jgi:hypothetical protein
MSYLKSFPVNYRRTKPATVFRAISKLWFIDKFHPETCRCEGCFLGPKGQLELKL